MKGDAARAPLLRSRFLWKLYAGYAAIIVLTAFLVWASMARVFRAESLAESDRVLHADVILLRELALRDVSWQLQAPGAGTQDLESLRLQVQRLGHEIDARLTLIAPDGQVLADSERDASGLDNHAGRPEVAAALRGQVGLADRFSATVGRDQRYYAIPIERDGKIVGVARGAIFLRNLDEHMDQLRDAVLLGALGAIVVALVLGFAFAQRLSRPLQEMAAAAARLAGGSYAVRLEVTSTDELGALARSLNTLAREMQASLAALEAERDKLQGILAGMAEGVVAVDRDERVVHLNQMAARLLAIREDVRSHPLWEVTSHHEVVETAAEAMAKAERVQRAWIQPGPLDRVFDLRASPLFTDGEVVGAVLVLEDVTQLRRLETMRRDFVGNVSHELKTPLTAIRGMVETLLDDPEAPPEIQRRFLQKVQAQAERMSNLVADLLSLSRLESGATLDRMPLDLRDPALASVKALLPVAEAKEVKLVVEMPKTPLLIDGEDESLRQAITNLLDNAIKYSPRQKSVTLRVFSQNNQAFLEVEDHGIGIEAHHRERIFERFYRVDKARSRELGGTGLGLAIVKHICLALGGEVTVDSTPGRGSTFRIRLPLAE